MTFLFSPDKAAYKDETLERYMLRIAKENFFDSYEQLSRAIRDALIELDHEAPVDMTYQKHLLLEHQMKRLN